MRAYKRRMSPTLPSPVLDALARGWTVVTSTQRAARWLRRGFDGEQRAAGKRFWEPARVFAWETWLDVLWRQMVLEGSEQRLLLSGIQENTVWRDVIEADLRVGAGAVRSPDSLARMASEAWKLLHAYRCREAVPRRADTNDTRAFVRWAAGFERICGREGYATAAELPGTFAEAAGAGGLKLVEPGLLLVGFDSMTPAQRGLIAELSARVEVEEFAGAGEPEASRAAKLVKTADAEEEREVCARWLRRYVEEHPGATAAVVVPSLAGERAAIERTFRHILAPELEDITGDPGALPFEFSLGVPLGSVLLVSAALEILSWAAKAMPLERVTALLLSPYFAGGGEYLARAEFDAFWLRRERMLEPTMTVEQVRRSLVEWKRNGSTPQLVRVVRGFEAEAGRARVLGLDGFARWAERFAALLEAAAWADGAELDSVEFQAQRRWQIALDRLATLDFAGRRVDYDTASGALREICDEMMFAPESQDAPVQVLGPLEAAGLQFDAVWFLGAGDLGWPVRARVNPLLPWSLQRELGMPGGDGERDTELARFVTRRISGCAPECWFSYAAESGEQHQRPSPLVLELEVEEHGVEEIVGAAVVRSPVPVLRVADESEISAPPEQGLHGGADLLKAQAACGFRAFAEKRLFSGEVRERELGLNAMERGSVIHGAMESFWGEVKTQDALRRLSRDERGAELGRAVDEALGRYAAGAGEGWARAYLDTERTRLMRLLGQWLEFEASRSAFVVNQLEESLRDVQIGPLRLSVRVDRVDVQMVDGEPMGEVLLDYKTGAVRPADWLGERPDEPQLPLYAVLRESAGDGSQPLAGVAFVTLRPGEGMKMAGFVAQDGVLPKGTKGSKMEAGDLAAQVERWRGVLEELARQFYEGEAAVTPKQYPTTCRYCEQRLLCRLNPADLEPEALDEMNDSDWEVPSA